MNPPLSAELVAAIAKARDEPAVTPTRWSVRIRAANGDVLADFALRSQQQLSRLALELTLLGYGVDPTDPSPCDIVFAAALADACNREAELGGD